MRESTGGEGERERDIDRYYQTAFASSLLYDNNVNVSPLGRMQGCTLSPTNPLNRVREESVLHTNNNNNNNNSNNNNGRNNRMGSLSLCLSSLFRDGLAIETSTLFRRGATPGSPSGRETFSRRSYYAVGRIISHVYDEGEEEERHIADREQRLEGDEGGGGRERGPGNEELLKELERERKSEGRAERKEREMEPVDGMLTR